MVWAMATVNTNWIVTRIDGKVASVCADYRHLALIVEKVASMPLGSVSSINVETVCTKQLATLSDGIRWEDLLLWGTPFQKGVWKQLYSLTHHENGTAVLPDEGIRLLSYSELAQRCGNPKGVRAVAHAVAVNPIAYIIPCHLIVPKESIDKILRIRSVAQGTIFKGTDLYLLDSIDVGEYEYGDALKRRLIEMQLYSR